MRNLENFFSGEKQAVRCVKIFSDEKQKVRPVESYLFALRCIMLCFCLLCSTKQRD